jgi:hypothetical protein
MFAVAMPAIAFKGRQCAGRIAPSLLGAVQLQGERCKPDAVTEAATRADFTSGG